LIPRVEAEVEAELARLYALDYSILKTLPKLVALPAPIHLESTHISFCTEVEHGADGRLKLVILGIEGRSVNRWLACGAALLCGFITMGLAWLFLPFWLLGYRIPAREVKRHRSFFLAWPDGSRRRPTALDVADDHKQKTEEGNTGGFG